MRLDVIFGEVPMPGFGRLLFGLLFLTAGCSEDASVPTVPESTDSTTVVPAAVTAWLDGNALPFDGTSLRLPNEDLEFLRDLIGDARIVSLGENTHGTRDFFEMKARILRFLVEEMDFHAFAIEATWPEANRLDRYVREGFGDPRELLSGLYFWTWNTESVLEMIQWIREHNEGGGNVGFYGFDMQYPGMALENVERFVESVAPDRTPEVTEALGCLRQFSNGSDGRFPADRYADQDIAYRTECGRALEAVRDLLLENQATFEETSGPDAFAIALQSLRVATQYHLMVMQEQGRDESMAENVVWLADRLGPASKLVLWAHNFHVSAQPGAQGSWLRSAFGDDMVVIGFSHETGQFTAVRQSGSSFVGLAQLQLDEPHAFSFEYFLAGATDERFVLDLRNLDLEGAGSSWLRGARPFRSIGCCYDPSFPGRYWATTALTDWFDVLIHIERTGPTTVLPFHYPGTF
jgi:erythromycin esterase